MDVDIVRNIHDAAVALRAECEQECPFALGAPDQDKAYTLERARVFTFLSTVN